MPKNTWYDKNTKRFCKYCPSCGINVQPFTTLSQLRISLKKNTKCRSCNNPLPKGAWYDDEIGKFCRKCPKCKEVILSKDRRRCLKAIKEKYLCRKCGIENRWKKVTRIYKKTFRESWYNKFIEGAIKRKLEWKLTKDNVLDEVKISEGKCFYTGIELSFGLEGEEITASIDRIDNKEGYMVGNIVICHKRVNIMKGAMPAEEFDGDNPSYRAAMKGDERNE
jgi:hypothetical protein